MFRVEPEPGTEVKAGTPVKLFVSVRIPRAGLRQRQGRAARQRLGRLQARPDRQEPRQDEHDPAWSADGSAVAYTSEGQVFLANLSKPDEAPKELTKKGEKFSDLAWAPPADVNVLAMAKIVDGASDLCLGKIDADGMTTACKEEPDITIERKINWAPDGKSILAFGFEPGTRKFGMVRWETKEPFSTNPADYSAGKIMTDTSKIGRGRRLDAAISPNGKQMAVVNLGSNGLPDLLLAKPDDFLLSDAKALGVRACKVIWRPDGKELVVVRGRGLLGWPTGELIRVPLDNPKDQSSLKLNGDNPVFQPLAAG